MHKLNLLESIYHYEFLVRILLIYQNTLYNCDCIKCLLHNLLALFLLKLVRMQGINQSTTGLIKMRHILKRVTMLVKYWHISRKILLHVSNLAFILLIVNVRWSVFDSDSE